MIEASRKMVSFKFYCFKQCYTLQVKFNFTYTMFVSTGVDGKPGAGGTGLKLKNGTWIGITGDLYYGRADLGVAIANTDKRSMTQ